MTIRVLGRQKSLMKPSVMPCIFARGLRSSGSFTTRASISVNKLPSGATRMYVYEGNGNHLNDVAMVYPLFAPGPGGGVAGFGRAWTRRSRARWTRTDSQP